jgi:hypothetical protein
MECPYLEHSDGNALECRFPERNCSICLALTLQNPNFKPKNSILPIARKK